MSKASFSVLPVRLLKISFVGKHLSFVQFLHENDISCVGDMHISSDAAKLYVLEGDAEKVIEWLKSEGFEQKD